LILPPLSARVNESDEIAQRWIVHRFERCCCRSDCAILIVLLAPGGVALLLYRMTSRFEFLFRFQQRLESRCIRFDVSDA
jgi:hypothetical protein